MFGEAAVTALVMIGVLLITSSFAVALSLLEVDEAVASGIMVVLGVVQGVVGIGARFGLHRAVGHGLGAAAIVVYCSGLLALGLSERALEPVCIVAGLLGFLVVTGLAVADEGRGLAGAAAFGLVGPVLSQLDSDPVAVLVGVLCLAYSLAISGSTVVGERLDLPVKLDVLGVQVPFVAFMASIAVFAQRAHLLSGSNAWEWETALQLGVYGGLVMLAGWSAGSRFSLVSGLGVLLFAQLPVLWAFGSTILAIAVLGVEGVALIAVAVFALMVGARRMERDRQDA